MIRENIVYFKLLFGGGTLVNIFPRKNTGLFFDNLLLTNTFERIFTYEGKENEQKLDQKTSSEKTLSSKSIVNFSNNINVCAYVHDFIKESLRKKKFKNETISILMLKKHFCISFKKSDMLWCVRGCCGQLMSVLSPLFGRSSRNAYVCSSIHLSVQPDEGFHLFKVYN